MAVLPWKDAVDIGHGRGRLAAAPAASLARVDRAFGRAADINEAWRSPADADENYRKYLNYLNGGPWAPIALPGDKSIHCFGFAVDTDDTSDAQMRVWNDHGWFWTVYRNGKLAERWHLEYFANRDNHRNDPAPAASKPPKPPALTIYQENDMSRPIAYAKGDKAPHTYAIYLDAEANNPDAQLQGAVYCARRYVTVGELKLAQLSGFELRTIPQADLDAIPKVYGSA